MKKLRRRIGIFSGAKVRVDFVAFAGERGKGPGLKAITFWAFFRGLKAPAPSGTAICNCGIKRALILLRLRHSLELCRSRGIDLMEGRLLVMAEGRGRGGGYAKEDQ